MVDHNAQWPQSSQKKTLKFLFVMARKSPLLKQTLIVCVLVLAVYAFVNAFFNPSDDSGRVITYYSRSYEGISGNSPKVRVYMYDLPRMFTYGIIEQHLMVHGANVSSLKYPGHQYSGEWYIFSDMNRPEEDRVGSPVVRVTDPDEADLFYVPVFSSLSTRVNNKKVGADYRWYSDEERQEELAEWLEKQEYWKRNNGWDHVIVAGDPRAMSRVIDRVKNAVLLVSDFGRLRPDQGSVVKDVIIPYSRMVKTCKGDLGVQDRKTLLFFMGNRFSKQGGKIRDLLFNVLETEEDVVIEHRKPSRENRLATIQGMYTSKFCLNPAGDTPSTRRLFDAIVSLCVPVIVSDEIELPFEDVIDYRKIAVFVETSVAAEPGFLASTLRGVTTEKIIEYQKELREVQQFFRYDHPNGTVNEIWREISQKLPLIKLMINRDKRLVRRQPSKSDCSCLCTNQTRIISSL